MTISPFNKSARLMWERGYSVIPIMPNDKMPAEINMGQWKNMLGWAKYCKELASEHDMGRWEAWPNANVGITLGSASQVVAVDYDDDVDNLHAKIQALLPPSYVKKVGGRGHTAFYRYNGEVNRDWKKNGVTVLQLLSSGRQTVVPPSIHPNGREYYYITEDTLEWVNPTELSYLPHNFSEIMDNLFGYEKVKIRNITTVDEYSQYYGETTVEEIQRALNYISPDGYQEWVEIGMALSQHLGDSGFQLWDSWSAKSNKYNAKGMDRKWHSFKHDGITISTLFYYAMDEGFLPKARGWDAPEGLLPLQPSEVHSPLGWALGLHDDESVLPRNRRAEREGVADIHRNTPNFPVQQQFPVSATTTHEGVKNTPESQINHNAVYLGNNFPQRLHNIPGLPGRISTWINRSALYPQPILSMGAALAFVGAIKGHRVRSETNIRTNIYVISIGETASGKDHPRKCLDILAQKSGVQGIMIGDPVSGPGLLNSIYRAKGRTLCQIDEVGLMISTLTGKNAAGHKKEIMTNIMKLYSSAGGIFLGAEYAGTDDKLNRRKDIIDPCFCLHGLTTPSRFFESMTSGEVIDGFLNRICLVVSDNFLPPENTNALDAWDVPETILTDVMAIQNMPTNAYADAGTVAADIEIKPLVIKFDHQARAILDGFKNIVRNRRISLHNSGNRFHAMWGRSVENAVKTALIVQEGDCITGRDMQWACDWTEYWTEYSVNQIKFNVADNDHERVVNKVIDVIKNYCDRTGNEFMSHTDLSRRTSKWLKMKDRNDVIKNLLDADMIEIQETESNGKISRRYKMT